MWQLLAVPTGCFVIAGLLAPVYSYHEFDLGLLLWQAVIGWPIGATLLAGAAALLMGARCRASFIVGDVALAVAGVVSIVIVNRTDDAQAGFGFLYAPVLGLLLVGAIRVIEWLRLRG
jgi:hypothetical protein